MANESMGPPAQVHGFLNIDKPRGLSSMDVVRRIKRLTGQRRRVGHGGTLDPLAQGVLPICFGQATRLMEYLVEYKKGYLMKVCLGVTTSTYDSEGEIVATRDVGSFAREEIEHALDSFRGTIYQIPPMYSALKHHGKRLYQLAREGIDVEREPRKVDISLIELTEFAPPSLVLKVECGRGVYMRSLAHQLGEELGCGGYLSQLNRTSSGPFRLEEAVPLELLEKGSEIGEPDSWKEHLRPLDYPLLQLKSMTVSKPAERLIRNGQSVNMGPSLASAGYMESYRAYTAEGRFLAVVRYHKGENQWKPYQVFQLETPSPYAPVAGTKG